MDELHVYIRMADTLVLGTKPKPTPKPAQHPPVPTQPLPQHHSPGLENVVERLLKPQSWLVGQLKVLVVRFMSRSILCRRERYSSEKNVREESSSRKCCPAAPCQELSPIEMVNSPSDAETERNRAR